MTFIVADRVKDSTTTTGTGTVTLSGSAPTGFQSFGSVMADGDTCYYVIAAGSEWEVGLGTYGSSGPTLARTSVLASSNSGSLVSFSAGSKDVFLDAPAEWLAHLGGIPAWDPPATGRYWSPWFLSGNQQQSLTTGRMYVAPYPVPRAFTADAFVFDTQTAASAGGTADCALYRANPSTRMPGALVVSATGIATDGSSGTQVATFTPQVITPDLYWIGLGAFTASATFRVFLHTSLFPMWTDVTFGSTLQRSGYRQDSVSAGSPPNPFTGQTLDRYIPITMLRSA